MSAQSPHDRVLIVDDDIETQQLLSRWLRSAGLACESATTLCEAGIQLKRMEFALVILDLELVKRNEPHGWWVLKEEDAPSIIVTTTAESRCMALKVMRAGAEDYIIKPFHSEEVTLSVTRALEKRQLQLEVRSYQSRAGEALTQRLGKLQEKNRELEQLISDIIESITVTIEVRDEYTAHHSHRVADLSVALAAYIGLDEEERDVIRHAALLHDIGKIGIRESVLHKPGRLTPYEMEHIKTHPLVAEQILRPLTHLGPLIPAIKHEHEAYDGSGYPDGLAGEEIPLHARLIAVTDAYDALTSDRPYRRALSPNAALRIIHRGAGRYWDPMLVECFGEMMARSEEA